MIITDYHIQSVLRTYTKQLQRSRLAGSSGDRDRSMPTEKVSISDEGKQRLLMERIKSQAMDQTPQNNDESAK
jgi:hypothetical protein